MIILIEILSVLLVIILISTLVYFIGIKPKTDFVKNIKEECNYNEDYDGCYTDTAVEIAIKDKDISICENGEILFLGDFNGPRCYSKYLQSYPFLEECEKVKINRYWCLGALARIKKDPNICLEELNNKFSEDQELGKDWCLDSLGFENVTGISICQKMGKNSYKTSCVTSEAEKQGDISICSQYIQREDEETTFRDIEVCKYQVARKTRDKTICDSIQIEYTKQLCESEFE